MNNQIGCICTDEYIIEWMIVHRRAWTYERYSNKIEYQTCDALQKLKMERKRTLDKNAWYYCWVQ